MGYQIRMAPQVEAWLAAVRDSDPAAADRIDEAVGALRAGGDRVGPPLVVTVDDPARSAAGPGGRRRGTGTQPDTAGPPRRSPHALAHWPWRSKPASDGLRWLLGQIGFFVARPGLDAAYKRQHVTMTRVRRAVADVATSRARLERQARQLDQQAAEPPGQRRAGMAAGQGAHADEGQPGDTADEGQPGDTAERLASLRQRYANLQAREERLMVVSRRFQAELDAFRDGQEAVVAAYTAAEEAAEVAWAEVAGNAGPGTGNAGRGTGGGASAAGEVGHAGPDAPAQPAFWLRELRPDAPESASTRILFTVEPPGTAVLLAAGMENDWLHAWYAEAIPRCSIRYRREHSSARETGNAEAGKQAGQPGRIMATACTARDGLGAGCRAQLGEEAANTALNVIADGADLVQGESGGVGEVPVEVALAWEYGAGVAAAHGDDEVGGLDLVAGERLRKLPGQVEADFGHGPDDGRVDLARGRRSCRCHPDAPGGLVIEQRGGHLGSAGVVDADEQDVRDIGHDNGLSVGARCLAVSATITGWRAAAAAKRAPAGAGRWRRRPNSSSRRGPSPGRRSPGRHRSRGPIRRRPARSRPGELRLRCHRHRR